MIRKPQVKEKPVMDILVDKHMRKIQEIMVIDNVAMGNDIDGDMPVKFIGNGEDWINPYYKGAPGQYKVFTTKNWIQFGK